MATLLVSYDTESAAVGEALARFAGPDFPAYLPALDPQTTVDALRVMRSVHEDLDVPATLFICGRTLLHSLESVQEAAATDLFDVQQHTYSHLVFRDVTYAPSPDTTITVEAPPPVVLEEEVAFTSDLIRRHIGHDVVGLRPPFGYYQGLRGRPDLLDIVRRAGIRYVSSWIRNEHGLNPTPWVQPFLYDAEGYADILEIPAQFWIDGIWFDVHGHDKGAEFLTALKGAVDHIVENDLVYGACFHDHTVITSRAEETGWLRGFLAYALERGVEIVTYTDFWRRTTNNP